MCYLTGRIDDYRNDSFLQVFFYFRRLCVNRSNAFHLHFSFENRVGKGHRPPYDRRLRNFGDQHIESRPEQSMGDPCRQIAAAF